MNSRSVSHAFTFAVAYRSIPLRLIWTLKLLFTKHHNIKNAKPAVKRIALLISGINYIYIICTSIQSLKVNYKKYVALFFKTSNKHEPGIRMKQLSVEV